MVSFSGCDKDKIKMKVIKDCTGTYLQKNGVDYKVCNDALLVEYSTGTELKVSYDVLELCFGLQEPITCTLAHVYQDNIEVTDIFD
jgi:hypothetical protein